MGHMYIIALSILAIFTTRYGFFTKTYSLQIRFCRLLAYIASIWLLLETNILGGLFMFVLMGFVLALFCYYELLLVTFDIEEGLKKVQDLSVQNRMKKDLHRYRYDIQQLKFLRRRLNNENINH